MAIDSTAELLFNISANADDAEENIQRFRALMGTDLEQMGVQFDSWAEDILGKLTTVQGAMIAMTAVSGAALLELGVHLNEAASEYDNYAAELNKAQRLTGLHAEQLSVLHEAAQMTGVDFGDLTNGLVKLEQATVKAAQGDNAQSKAFAALGISQKDVIAGQTDMMPLLEKVMAGLSGTASAAQRAALAKDLMSRSGVNLLAMMAKEPNFLKLAKEAVEAYHTELTDPDLHAAQQYQAAQRAVQAATEATNLVLGKATLGMRTWFNETYASFIQLFSGKGFEDGGNWVQAWMKNFTALKKEITDATAAAGKAHDLLDKTGADGVPDAGKIKAATQDFYGLTSVLESMKSKIAANGSEWDKVLEEISHYGLEIGKANQELTKLEAAGKVTADSAARETAVLAQLPAMMTRIMDEARDKIIEKQIEAGEKQVEIQDAIHLQLLDKLATYTDKGYAQQVAAWVKEMDAYRASLMAKGPPTEENLELMDQLNKAGLAKIARTQLDAQTQLNQQLLDKLAVFNGQTEAMQEAKLAKEMDALRREAAAKGEISAETDKLLDQINQAGLDKIYQTQMMAFQKELVTLEDHLAKIVLANVAGDEKLNIQYQTDLSKFSEVEEKKSLATAKGEAERATIEAFYNQIRAALLQKHQNDLNALHDSQGWQGVFGNFFGSMIKGNTQLYQQWAQSANQSLSAVAMALEATKEMSEKAFASMAQGMAQSAVQAFVTEKSISQAMRQAAASTLESFASQAVVAAIMSMGWGLYDLGMGYYPEAANQFAASAIFATVGGAAAVLGRAVTPPTAATGSGAGAASSASASSAASSTAAGTAATPQPTVNVYIAGHVIGPSGAAQLADIISQAVYNNDVTMYASHNANGVQLQG